MLHPKPMVIAVQRALTEIGVCWKMAEYLKRVEAERAAKQIGK